MIDYSQFPYLLLNSAFKSKLTFKKTGKSIKGDYSNISKTFLGDIAKTITSINPGSKSKIDWAQFTESLNNTNPGRYKNLGSRVAEAMKKAGLNDTFFDTQLIEKYIDILDKAKTNHISLQ